MRDNTKAKKSLGQNFLSDPKILEKIADTAEIKSTDTVIEVGPGRGALTQYLLKKAKKVIAIEKDEALAEELKKEFGENLELIIGDILEIDPNMFPKDYILTGNIPYYITGEIFRKFLESENPPKSITFVIQKEVGDRIMARDGKESVLSISVKAYGTPEYGGIIKAGSFNPVPKVDSGIISIRDISKKKFIERAFLDHSGQDEIRESESASERNFFLLVKKGFAHKRKFLIKNLELPAEIFQKIGLPLDIRAEDLSIDNWFDILKACQAAKLSPFS